MEKKFEIVISVLIIILGVGFVIGGIWPALSICTLKGCPCFDVEGERPCNDCSSTNPVFVTIVFNVVKSCNEKEIIKCSEGRQVDRRIDFIEDSCSYGINILGIDPKYIPSVIESIGESRNKEVVELPGRTLP